MRGRVPGLLATLAVTAVTAVTAVPSARADATAASRLEPPLRVTLEGTARGDDAEVTATIAVRGRLAATPILRIALPDGATLVQGLPEEAVAGIEPGTDATRRFGVRGLGAGRVTVMVDAASPAAGAHAEASWPAPFPVEAVLCPQAPRTEPIPPVTVGGVRIDRAVPLSPAKRQGE